MWCNQTRLLKSFQSPHAAEQSGRLAQYYVASWFMNGSGTETVNVKSLSFYIKFAEQGLDEAQFAVWN